jgi:hypothetical protein
MVLHALRVAASWATAFSRRPLPELVEDQENQTIQYWNAMSALCATALVVTIFCEDMTARAERAVASGVT